MSSTADTFGIAAEMPRNAAEDLRGLLVALWKAAHHRNPSGLRPDLNAHYDYFNPVASGTRLRRILAQLDELDVPVTTPDALFIRVTDTRALITPEGRVALDLLDDALEQAGTVVRIDAEVAESRTHELLALYRDWSRGRLTQVIDLLGGGETKLQLPAIGATLTLLVNRSDGPERAITRFGLDNRVAQATVDEAFFRSAASFAKEIPSGRRRKSDAAKEPSAKERLISGWTLHEVTRRLPGALVINEDSVYVAPKHDGQVLDLIARELQRRKGIDAATVGSAFDALVREFRHHASALAGFGMLYERPAETARLRTRLLERFQTIETE